MPERIASEHAAIDPGRALSFSFDGRPLTGCRGDTLASALLANGVDVVGRSVQLGRPRGIFAAGVEEPNALVELRSEGRTDPMVRATTLELFDGLAAAGLAGRGRAVLTEQPVPVDKRDHHCDLLVIGGGAAGLAAAADAAAQGQRLMLVEEQPVLGGHLNREREPGPGLDLFEQRAAALAATEDALVLTRATALALLDHGYAVVAERLAAADGRLAGERLWRVRCDRVVLATGAIERPIVFSGNDRPGVMLAGAARTYANRFAVRPGRRAVAFTSNDSAYEAVADLLAGGVEVPLLLDARPDPPPAAVRRLRELGVEVRAGSAVIATAGADRVESVRVAALDGDGRLGAEEAEVACDLLAVSGGWTPTLQLYAQAGGRLRYEPAIAAHVPAGARPGIDAAGAATGVGLTAARALWCVPPPAGGDWEEHFVDLQRDATVADVRRALDAGLRSPEHVKRYTTIGTGEDQGKTSNLNALGVIAACVGEPIEALAPTTYRPLYAPVPFALLAGRNRGRLHDPIRTTAIHRWHERAGAVFEDVGQWKRPRYYPEPGEDMDAATLRECAAAREGVALMDASTLGKIDVQGPDAGEFLDRLYTNLMSTLAVGSCRYGVLCGADGMVFDDGVVMHVGADHYVTTTTTGGAAGVLDWMEEWLQTEWPELRVRLTSVTDHWATIAVAGPDARRTLAKLVAIDLDAEAFPFMAIRETEIAGTPVRLCRVSFSGELAYEIHLPARCGLVIWEAVFDAGAEYGIAPYGTEAMHVLRAEKGYVIVGQDSDGTNTPQDLGMAWIVSKKKDFFVGRRSHRRPDGARADRRQLVGLLPEDPELRFPEGAQLLRGGPGPPATAGHVTSSYSSAALGRTFALALLERGRERHGESVRVAFDGRQHGARVTGTVFYDPEDEHRDGRPA